jgi:predicted Zn-dependent peptidase
MYKVTRLENGLAVATAEMPHMASVSVGVWVGVGGRHEPAALNGVSHFIEHLLFKGTRRRSAREISQAVEGIGGYLNAFTSEEQTCFYAKAGHEHFQHLWEVLADMFLNSTFDRVEIDKERDVIKEELAMYIDQPQQYVQELLNTMMWPDQPLGRSITGTEKSLDALGRQQLVDYQRANYVAPATLVVVGGRISHAEAVRAVKQRVRKFAKGRRPGYTPAASAQTRPVVQLLTRKTEQTQAALGIRTCSRHDEWRFALRLLNVILGENMSSRLFQSVREEHGLAYSIYSGNSFFDDAGDIVISAGLDADNLGKALRIIMREIKRLSTELAPAAELRRARDYINGQMDLSLENSENQMMWVGEQWLSYGRIPKPDEYKKRLSEVSPSDVRAAARQFFRTDRYNLALISPLKSAAGLDKILSA